MRTIIVCQSKPNRFEFDCDLDVLEAKFPGIIRELAYHGVKQLVADAGSSATEDPKKKWNRINQSGFTFAAGGGGGARLSPLEVAIRHEIAMWLMGRKIPKAKAEKAAANGDWKKILPSEVAQEAKMAEWTKTAKESLARTADLADTVEIDEAALAALLK